MKQENRFLCIKIPNGNRCCKDHLIKNRFYEDQIAHLDVVSHSSSLELNDLTKLLTSLSISCDTPIIDSVGDFTLPEDRLYVFTGFTWKNIIELRRLMTSLRDSSNRSLTQALIVFLLKLRSGNSNEMIAAVLGLDDPRKVSNFSQSILQAFEHEILPIRFGFQAVNREDLIKNHTTDIVKNLHNVENNLVLIADGTYVHYQKSKKKNYLYANHSLFVLPMDT